MKRDLTQRRASRDDRGEQHQTVVSWLLAVRQVQHDADAGHDEAHPLEQAQRAGKLADDELVVERHQQHRRQAGEREDIERATRHHSVMSSFDVA